MRAFHVTWVAFFVCFFSWFAVAPLMPTIREELGLTRGQIGNAMVASVAVTILARLAIGRLLDSFGPRRTYTALLALCAFPILGLAMAQSYTQFLIARLFVGIVGASFVITQYHTSVMFAPNVVGTANATTAGWGNLGGGVTQVVMPLVMLGVVSLGVTHGAWRYALVLPAVLMLVMSVVYYRATQDTPAGNYPEARPASAQKGSFMLAAKDYRVWVLALAYAACFGVELTINNMAALYFHDTFELGLREAGFIAGIHGLMNLFARALGGVLGDKAGLRGGLRGRVRFLTAILFLEGIALVVFSRLTTLGPAIALLVVFSLFVEMACGATYSIVPLVNDKALGSVSGLVGAGGNIGAVAFGLLFGIESLAAADALFFMGGFVLFACVGAYGIRFSDEHEQKARDAIEASMRSGEPASA